MSSVLSNVDPKNQHRFFRGLKGNRCFFFVLARLRCPLQVVKHGAGLDGFCSIQGNRSIFPKGLSMLPGPEGFSVFLLFQGGIEGGCHCKPRVSRFPRRGCLTYRGYKWKHRLHIKLGGSQPSDSLGFEALSWPHSKSVRDLRTAQKKKDEHGL